MASYRTLSEVVEEIIPGGWKQLSLADLAADVFGGGTPSTKKPEYWDGDQPWTTSAIIQGDAIDLKRPQRYITVEALQQSSARVAPKGSVLVGTRVGVGKAVVTHLDVAINQDLTAIVPNAEVLPDFLALAMKQPFIQVWFQQNMRGSTIKGVPRGDLLGLTILLPPVREQAAIVRVLRAVHQAKEAAENVIEATRQLKRSLTRHLFMYGSARVYDAERVSLKDTEIGPVPEHWQVTRLADIATIERGKFAHRPRNDPAFYGGDIPFIQTGDVTAAAALDGHIRAYSQTLNAKGLVISRVFPKGTIAITIAANIGYAAILDFDSAFPDSVIGIIPTGDTSVAFLNYYLATQQAEMDRKAPRGTQKNINIEFLRPWPVKVPPVEEQKRIAALLSAVDLRLRAYESRRRVLGVFFRALLRDLMAGKRRLKSQKVVADV